jgi:hypothetical protein
MKRIEATYSAGDVQKLFPLLTRARLHKLITWGIISPSEQTTGAGISNLYTEGDLLTLAVVHELLILKIEIRMQKKIMAEIRETKAWEKSSHIFIQDFLDGTLFVDLVHCTDPEKNMREAVIAFTHLNSAAHTVVLSLHHIGIELERKIRELEKTLRGRKPIG